MINVSAICVSLNEETKNEDTKKRETKKNLKVANTLLRAYVAI